MTSSSGARKEVLSEPGAALSHLLGLKARDSRSLFHPLGAPHARSCLLEQGDQFRSQFFILGHLLFSAAEGTSISKVLGTPSIMPGKMRSGLGMPLAAVMASTEEPKASAMTLKVSPGCPT